MNEMSRVLLTGAAGFVGSAMHEHLCQSGLEVIACDRHGATHTLDVLDREHVLEVIAGARPHTLIHAAAITTPHYGNDLELIEVNVRGTMNLLEAAERAGVQHFVLFSSSGVYAPEPNLIDEHAPTSSATPYGLSKLLAEEVCVLGRTHNMTTWLLRLGPVYGPREQASETRSRTSLIHLIVQAIHSGEHCSLPRNQRDVYNWLHTRDLAELLERIVSSRNDGQVNLFNVAGLPVTGSELIEAFQAVWPSVDFQRLLDWHPAPPPRHGPLDCSKITQALNWTPAVSLLDGLREFLKPLEVQR